MPTLPPILFFTPDPPGAIWQDKPQLARRLGQLTPLLVTPEEPTLRGNLPWDELLHPALSRQTDDVYALHWSPLAPLTGAALLGPLTATLRRRRLLMALRRVVDASIPPSSPTWFRYDSGSLLSQRHHSPPAPILWFFRPGQQHWIQALQPRLVIYHVVDEYSAYPGLTAAQAARQSELDRQLSSRADLVFCTAQSLVEARRVLNPHTYYLPNAVDYAAFSAAAASPPTSQSPDLPSHQVNKSPTHQPANPPILAVVGGINAKVDLALLAELAARRPQWQLKLVGPVSASADAEALVRLRSLSNVIFQGATPPEQVPAVLAGCDVALIPYRLTEQTRHVNPLKVYEYLAAGRAVVATPLPELRQFEPLVRLADDVNSFAAAVEAALAEGNAPDALAARQAIAAANTWDHRVARMVELIKQRLAETQPSA